MGPQGADRMLSVYGPVSRLEYQFIHSCMLEPRGTLTYFKELLDKKQSSNHHKQDETKFTLAVFILHFENHFLVVFPLLTVAAGPLLRL